MTIPEIIQDLQRCAKQNEADANCVQAKAVAAEQRRMITILGKMARTKVLMDGDPVSCDAALREIRVWLGSRLEDGPKETRGHQDNSGHPHYWTAVLIPDWDIKQKISLADDALVQQEIW